MPRATAGSKTPSLNHLLDARVPVALIDRGKGHISVPLVRGDDEKGIRLAFDQLRALGHTYIAHLAGTSSVTSGHHSHLQSTDELGCVSPRSLHALPGHA